MHQYFCLLSVYGWITPVLTNESGLFLATSGRPMFSRFRGPQVWEGEEQIGRPMLTCRRSTLPVRKYNNLSIKGYADINLYILSDHVLPIKIINFAKYRICDV